MKPPLNFRLIGAFIHESLGSSRDYQRHRQSGSSGGSSVLSGRLNTGTPNQPVALDPFTAAVRSFGDFEHFAKVQLINSIGLPDDQAQETSGFYAEMLVLAGYDINVLGQSVRNFCPPEPEFQGEPPQTVYGYLLGTLRDIPFSMYPRLLADSGLDAHQTNIVRIVMEYFSRKEQPERWVEATPTASSKESDKDLDKEGIDTITPPPYGGNTVDQLPRRNYVIVSVSVDTVTVEGRPVVWQISTHAPDLAATSMSAANAAGDSLDPDYECLMVPGAIADKPTILAELGFTYNAEKKAFYHQGSEFGRRKADREEVGLEKLANYLDVSMAT